MWKHGGAPPTLPPRWPKDDRGRDVAKGMCITQKLIGDPNVRQIGEPQITVHLLEKP